MSVIYPVIMCGGSGSRMWPLSRQSEPKQYLSLLDDSTLLESTIKRANAAPSSLSLEAPVLICGCDQASEALAQSISAGRPASAVIVEPFGRNTAAAAAVAALHVAERDPEGFVLLLPADHHMAAPEEFWAGVEKGLAIARDGDLVTLGIEPESPETGYGYINAGERIADGVHAVAAFKEKPDLATARSYLSEGGYYWNSGIFLFRADAMIREFEALAEDILRHCDAALRNAEQSGVEIRLDASAFGKCRSEPVDTEIMERTSRAAVVGPLRAGWDDIGSWAALTELLTKTGDSGALGRGDVLRLGCEGGMVRSEGPFVAAVGLKDIVVVAAGDAVLVVHKDHAQQVKSVVETLKRSGRTELL